MTTPMTSLSTCISRTLGVTVFFAFSLISTDLFAQDDLVEIFENYSPSVLTVIILDKDGKQRRQGSGFIVDKSGIAATSLPLIERAVTIELKSTDGKVRIASSILRIDRDWGVALLQTEEFDAPALELAKPNDIHIGMDVVTMGSPEGVNVTLSQGVVLGKISHADSDDLLQISNAIGSGSVGGPVITDNGDVIGLAAAMVRRGQPVRLAIPSRIIAALLDEADPDNVVQDLARLSEKIEETEAVLDILRTEMEQECKGEDLAMLCG